MIRKIIIILILQALYGSTVIGQNSYGWERIYNSLYGINGFYINSNSDGNKFWIIRPIYNTLGSGYYDFLRYNENSNIWYPFAHSSFKAVYYSYYVGGGFSYSGYTFPPSFAVSAGDTNFNLVNTVVPHTGSPPYDIRMFYSYVNGVSNNEIDYFRLRQINTVVINPLNDSINLLTSGDTVFKSIDRAITWSPISIIPNFRGDLMINQIDTNYLYAVGDSFYASSNGGISFQNVLNKKFTELICPGPSNRLVGIIKNKFFRSSDFGYSWIMTDSLSDSINTIDYDPDNNNIFFAGTKNGLYKSTDAGDNFYLFNNSFSPSRNVIALCKKRNSNFIYSITEEAVYKCWTSYIIGIVNNSSISPDDFALYQNSPNPFNPVTKIKYNISKSSLVTLIIFDDLGREIKTLVNEFKDSGIHEIEWDASSLSSGIYFYRLRAGNFTETKKMMLLK